MSTGNIEPHSLDSCKMKSETQDDIQKETSEKQMTMGLNKENKEVVAEIPAGKIPYFEDTLDTTSSETVVTHIPTEVWRKCLKKRSTLHKNIIWKYLKTHRNKGDKTIVGWKELQRIRKRRKKNQVDRWRIEQKALQANLASMEKSTLSQKPNKITKKLSNQCLAFQLKRKPTHANFATQTPISSYQDTCVSEESEKTTNQNWFSKLLKSINLKHRKKSIKSIDDTDLESDFTELSGRDSLFINTSFPRENQYVKFNELEGQHEQYFEKNSEVTSTSTLILKAGNNTNNANQVLNGGLILNSGYPFFEQPQNGSPFDHKIGNGKIRQNNKESTASMTVANEIILQNENFRIKHNNQRICGHSQSDDLYRFDMFRSNNVIVNPSFNNENNNTSIAMFMYQGINMEIFDRRLNETRLNHNYKSITKTSRINDSGRKKGVKSSLIMISEENEDKFKEECMSEHVNSYVQTSTEIPELSDDEKEVEMDLASLDVNVEAATDHSDQEIDQSCSLVHHGFDLNVIQRSSRQNVMTTNHESIDHKNENAFMKSFHFVTNAIAEAKMSESLSDVVKSKIDSSRSIDEKETIIQINDDNRAMIDGIGLAVCSAEAESLLISNKNTDQEDCVHNDMNTDVLNHVGFDYDNNDITIKSNEVKKLENTSVNAGIRTDDTQKLRRHGSKQISLRSTNTSTNLTEASCKMYSSKNKSKFGNKKSTETLFAYKSSRRNIGYNKSIPNENYKNKSKVRVVKDYISENKKNAKIDKWNRELDKNIVKKFEKNCLYDLHYKNQRNISPRTMKNIVKDTSVYRYATPRSSTNARSTKVSQRFFKNINEIQLKNKNNSNKEVMVPEKESGSKSHCSTIKCLSKKENNHTSNGNENPDVNNRKIRRKCRYNAYKTMYGNTKHFHHNSRGTRINPAILEGYEQYYVQNNSNKNDIKDYSQPFIIARKAVGCPIDVPPPTQVLQEQYPSCPGCQNTSFKKKCCWGRKCGGKRCRQPGECRRHPGSCGSHTRQFSQLPGRCSHYPALCNRAPRSCKIHKGHCDCHSCHARTYHKLHCIRCGDFDTKCLSSDSSDGSSSDSYIADFLSDLDKKIVDNVNIEGLYKRLLHKYNGEQMRIMKRNGLLCPRM